MNQIHMRKPISKWHLIYVFLIIEVVGLDHITIVWSYRSPSNAIWIMDTENHLRFFGIYLSQINCVDLVYHVLCIHCMDILDYFQREDLTMCSILEMFVTKQPIKLCVLLYKLLIYYHSSQIAVVQEDKTLQDYRKIINNVLDYFSITAHTQLLKML